MNIQDLKPGMDQVTITVKVLSVSDPKQIITKADIEHKILETKVGDETGSITLVFWNEKIMPLKVGEELKIENGFVTSFKGNWRINVGRYGKVAKI